MKNDDHDGSGGEQLRHGFKDVNVPLRLHSADLDDRQRRAVKLWLEAEDADGLVMTINDGLTVWFSSTDPTRAYQVARKLRNRRGVLNFEYACQCAEFGKNGRIDCMHILAEKLRRGEVIIDGAVGQPSTTASRRPPRDVRAIDGTPARTALRRALVDMPFQIHRLINSLVASSPSPKSAPPHRKRRGGQLTEAASRAAALLHKIVEGCSADTMISRYQALIDDGILPLNRPPHQNTLSAWMNDSSLTPILSTWLARTALPFRACEVGGIIDSSKVSQMRTAHPRHVDYGNDVRDAADWMKVHTLVGVNTLVVMAARFSGSRGEGTGDPAFLIPLVSDALAVFSLKYVLGDKAYLAEKLLGWLWERSIRAAIPLKKRTDPLGWVEHPEAAAQLAKWYDDDQRSFHEVYRLRPKVESLFSAMNRVTSDYCWSRGRQRSEVKNADEPCVAWVNETLCKLIYMNLRTTVFYEVLTSCTIDYRHPERCFPPLTNAVLAA